MKAMRKTIRLGTHGEQYGNWMPVSMLSLMGGLLALAAALAALCFAAFHWNVLGVLFTLAALALAVALCWFAWMRRQFAFGDGGIMEQVHQTVLSHLDFDGKGQILDVGCGSGALSIRAALVWPQARVLGIRGLDRLECTVMPVMPLMVSATETAEELSAAAVTRGIENPARKTSAVSLRMPAADCIGMLAVFILLVLSYVVQ